MIEQCSRCNGTKQILKVGNMIAECDVCGGIGHVKVKMPQKNKSEIKLQDEGIQYPQIRVKRKYSKKIKPELMVESAQEHAS